MISTTISMEDAQAGGGQLGLSVERTV